ncbi:MAG: glutathione S-transferase family protein [Gammaproteobacteria bacterium]|nr:glutathione S-transferase family protein [Gammaproteobacteria bacterium]
MKLLYTPASPYGRIVRIQIIECALSERIEMEQTVTRVPGAAIYGTNPTGKVPCLVLTDGTVITETRHIMEMLDAAHDGPPMLSRTPTPAERAFDGFATGMLDGVSVWIREARRPKEEQSPNILAQEARRLDSCVNYAETIAADLEPTPSYARLALAVSIATVQWLLPEAKPLVGRPSLSQWYDNLSNRPSFVATKPPGA